MKLNRRITILLIITLNILCYSQFSGGSGTVEDPYQIATAEHLNNIRYYLTSSFIQIADIDLGVAPWNEGEGWDPIGDYNMSDPTRSFRGNFDGNYFKIANMSINRPLESYLGLFGSIENSDFRSINLVNFKIIGGAAIGGIVAISYLSFISNCNSEGYIEGHSELGLLMYFFEGYNIINCHTKGEIISNDGGWIGGLVSMCNADSVKNCSVEVMISSNKNMI